MGSVIQALTQRLLKGTDLTDDEAARAVGALTDETIAVEAKADFLSALAGKGESLGEITAFARLLRDRSIQPALDEATRREEILDVVGTGGDKLKTINISSTAALLCAAAGITVAKHGNRAITSKSGSADVLEACGIRIDLQPPEAAAALRDQGFAFFFAPHYHPAFKQIAPARRLCAERGQRTIFNFLGPLLNPARPSAMLVGVARPELCEPFAHVLQSLGVRRGMVVCGSVPLDGGRAQMDEISTLGETTIAEFYQERGFTVSTLSPDLFPLQSATLADLEGGDRDRNAATLRRILNGEERGPKREAVLMNTAAGLFVAGRCRSLLEGWETAAKLIDSGAASAKLDSLVKARPN
jgi:anthranilate phosphoribosyltransferase